ncbi:hypothetical protein HAX54_022500, partial [Datura stramonium]|nr:hypothetical protein [Datura stramonium]
KNTQNGASKEVQGARCEENLAELIGRSGVWSLKHQINCAPVGAMDEVVHQALNIRGIFYQHLGELGEVVRQHQNYKIFNQQLGEMTEVGSQEPNFRRSSSQVW